MRMDRIGPVDAGTLLLRALRASAAAAGCTVAIESLAARPWSSATFTGTRHRVVLALEADAAAWLDALPEAEFALRGHLVADLAVVARGDGRAMIDVLTLVEG